MNQKVSVQIKVSNQKVAEDLKKIVSSLEEFCIRNSENIGPCDLLIIEIGNDLTKEIRLLNSIRTSGFVRKLFLISSNLDPLVLIQAKKAAGAKKIFVLPLPKEQLCNALLEFREEENGATPAEEKGQSGKSIYLMGCKGGVGTTTIAMNMASNLAEIDKSQSVVLTDITLPFGDIPTLLNIKASPNWVQLSKNISRIDSGLLKSILFKYPLGFFVLPSPLEGKGGCGMTLANFEKLLSVLQKSLDFIVIDGGTTFTKASMKALEMAETVLITSNPTVPCIANVKRLLSTLHMIEPSLEEKTKIVVNRCQKNSSITLEEMEQKLGKKIFWKIPNDYQTVIKAITQGRTICEVGNGRQICRAFRELTVHLLAEGKKDGDKRGFLGRLIDKPKLADVALTFYHKTKSAQDRIGPRTLVPSNIRMLWQR